MVALKAVEMRGVSFSYRASDSPAVQGLNLTIDEGEFILVTGPTGSGKSTLLRLMNGLIPHFHEGELSGQVIVIQKDTIEERPARLASLVGTVFQTPEEQIVGSKVSRDVAFGLENLLMSRQQIRVRVEEALALVGLSNLGNREVFSLSGGEKQRLALASVLAMKPRLLLLDEPAAELDPQGRASILRILESLSGKVTIVLADHRLSDVAHLVDRVIVLSEGRIAFEGPPREVLSRPEVADLGVEVPLPVELWRRMAVPGSPPRQVPLTLEEMADSLEKLEVYRG